MYRAALRPAEATALRDTDCDLPEEGWGTLTLARSLPVTAKEWTDSGQRHADRRAGRTGGLVLLADLPAQGVRACSATCPYCDDSRVHGRTYRLPGAEEDIGMNRARPAKHCMQQSA